MTQSEERLEVGGGVVFDKSYRDKVDKHILLIAILINFIVIKWNVAFPSGCCPAVILKRCIILSLKLQIIKSRVQIIINFKISLYES